MQSFVSFDKCRESCNHHQTQSMDHHPTEFPFEVPLVFYTPDEKQNVIQRVVNILFFATCLIFISHIESFEEDGVPSTR